jgi:hypothetical protein
VVPQTWRIKIKNNPNGVNSLAFYSVESRDDVQYMLEEGKDEW